MKTGTVTFAVDAGSGEHAGTVRVIIRQNNGSRYEEVYLTPEAARVFGEGLCNTADVVDTEDPEDA